MFALHPDLFEARVAAMEALEAAGYFWLQHFASVDITHDERILEICGIKEREMAKGIFRAIQRAFPHWGFRQVWCKDFGIEQGWIIEFRVPPAR
jgi:hypothetical protein